jgi:predicted 2-oxoglutarate/Fe(II)-dependent dioxygenase YbiX
MDLPFLWTSPVAGDTSVSVVLDDTPRLSAVRTSYHGLEGNEHLQQPFVYKGVFTPEQCERISAIGRSRPIWNGRSTSDDEEYRICKTSWIEEVDDAAFIYERLREVVRSVNELYQVAISGFAEPLHYVEYDVGGRFEWHTDLGNGPMSTRKISLSVQLSDDDEYAGGDLEFCPHGAIDEFRGIGNVIAFPAYIAHRVTPVASGRRHALVAWIHGPSFR